MYCTKCGAELRPDANYCSGCGARTGTSNAVDASRTLMLDKRNKKIGGVCAGFARYFDVDPILVRVLWLGIALCTGVGFLAYLAAWIIMPAEASVDVRRAADLQTN